MLPARRIFQDSAAVMGLAKLLVKLNLSAAWFAVQAANGHDDVLRADNSEITNVSGSRRCSCCQ